MNEGGQIVRTVLGASYKEAETISMRATKENIEFTSPDEVRFHGKDGGKKFGDFEKKKEDKPLKVTKVEGPFDKNGKKATIIKKGEFYTFKATPSRKPSNAEVKLMKWAIKYDNGKIKELVGFSAYNKLIDGKIVVTFKTSEDFEKAKVYAYFIKASEKVSVAIMLKNLKFPMLIIQSIGRKGKKTINKNGIKVSSDEIAIDLLYKDYLENGIGFEKLRLELYKETYNVDKQDSIYNITSRENNAKKKSDSIIAKIKEFSKKSDSELFTLFYDEAENVSKGKLEENIKRMILRMQNNQGGEYSHIDLSNAVIEHENTKKFIQSVKNWVVSFLKEYKNNLENLEIIDNSEGVIYNTSFKTKVDKPKFNNNSDTLSGIQIAINDVWAYQIYLNKYYLENDKPHGELEFHFYDHFGLDYPDIEKFDYDIFIAWFILQHFRGYKPFITSIKFTSKF